MVVRGSGRKKRKDTAMSARNGGMLARDVVRSKYVMDATIRWIRPEDGPSSESPAASSDGGFVEGGWRKQGDREGSDDAGAEAVLKARRQAMQSARLEIQTDEDCHAAAADSQQAAATPRRAPPNLDSPRGRRLTLEQVPSLNRAVSSFDYDAELRMTIRTLEPLFNLSALEPPGFLDRFVENYHEAMQRMRWSSSFFTSTPFTASLSTRVVRAFVFILGIGCLLSCIVGILIPQPNQPSLIRPQLQHSMFRFSALLQRNGEPASAPMIQTFGLTLNGVPLEDRFMRDTNYTIDGPNMELVFPRPIQYNGWFLVTGNNPPELDAMVFTLYASMDGGTWITVGQSGWFTTGELNTALYVAGPSYLDTDRNARQIFDYKISWQAILHNVFGLLVVAIGCFLCVFFAHCHNEKLGARCFGAGFAGYSFILFIDAISAVASNISRVAILQSLDMIAAGSIALVTLRYESFTLQLLVFGGLYFLIVTVVESVVVVSDPHRIMFGIGMVLMMEGLAFTALFFRRQLLRESRQLIQKDQEKYDDQWEKMRQEEGATENLSLLEAKVNRIQAMCHSRYARQLNRVRDAASARGSAMPFRSLRSSSRKVTMMSMQEPQQSQHSTDSEDAGMRLMVDRTSSGIIMIRTVPGSVCVESPVFSLDQLYVQAAGLNQILRQKVLAWASVSNGFFPRADTDKDGISRKNRSDWGLDSPGVWGRSNNDYVSWQKVQQQSTIAKWATIKRHERAVEKVIRSYKGDVSRLLDVCRQSVILKNVSDIVACVSAIDSDPETRVVRVKNRLSPSYNSKVSAGYRDVAVNLRIVNAETIRWGIDTHVCEVQLIPFAHAIIKSAEGHARYVRYRDTRGQ